MKNKNRQKQFADEYMEQYGELLDRVKNDFQERLNAERAKFNKRIFELRKELKAKDKMILRFEAENENLGLRLAELETELSSWRKTNDN